MNDHRKKGIMTEGPNKKGKKDVANLPPHLAAILNHVPGSFTWPMATSRTHAEFMGQRKQSRWLDDLFDRHAHLVSKDEEKNAEAEAEYQDAYEAAAPGFYNKKAQIDTSSKHSVG